MNNPIESAVKRGRGYWFVDGFTELFAGLWMALIGGAMLLRALVPQESFASKIFGMVGDIGAIKLVGLIAVVALLSWLKDRFTYPRSGFVRAKRVSIGELAVFARNAFLIALVPMLIILAVFILIPETRAAIFSLPAWLPVVLGMALAGFLAATAQSLGLFRFRWLGLGALTAGLAVCAWQWSAAFPAVPAELLRGDLLGPLPAGLAAPLMEMADRLSLSLGVWSVVLGALFCISGLVTFLRYRRENPAVSTGEES
jgi:hypothetical protein